MDLAIAKEWLEALPADQARRLEGAISQIARVLKDHKAQMVAVAMEPQASDPSTPEGFAASWTAQAAHHRELATREALLADLCESAATIALENRPPGA